MRNYILFRCIIGLISSIVSAGVGIAFIVAGVKDNDSKGYLVGSGLILASIIGTLICLAFIIKSKK
ncbi:MAG: hypothetical protein LBP62_01915 [Clostridiales bacterium]|jgi:hypothetical protein|nr:hypothetical protein [Clostridiales bacterium]